jgi:hypothetical protein
MPTVLRRNGFDLRIYTGDHAPPHVHIWKAGKEVVISLRQGAEIPVIREVNRMSKNDVRRAYAIVEQSLEYLRHRWREIHG